MNASIKNNLASAALFFTRPTLLFYLLPWLMFLLVGGTVAQRYIGLYQSEKLFFGSFIFWLGPVPLPGAYTTLALIALCLVAKLILKSPWEKSQAGIIITHISVLVLLAGGLVSALDREEGYMVLGPGETGSTVSDYHSHELAILKNGKLLFMVPQDALHPGTAISRASLPFVLHVDATCMHCTVHPRVKTDASLRGAARKIDIISAPLRSEEAENQPGIVFEVSGLSALGNGRYIAAEALAEAPVIMQGKDRYVIVMRHAERELPFAVQLTHFEKSNYPGTEMARGYRSDIRVKDGALAWNTSIEMNQPLRHAGYTLYQSSFVENRGQLFTVLAVVKNAGASFPYIAIATLCFGLLLHLGITFAPKVRA